MISILKVSKAPAFSPLRTTGILQSESSQTTEFFAACLQPTIFPTVPWDCSPCLWLCPCSCPDYPITLKLEDALSSTPHFLCARDELPINIPAFSFLSHLMSYHEAFLHCVICQTAGERSSSCCVPAAAATPSLAMLAMLPSLVSLVYPWPWVAFVQHEAQWCPRFPQVSWVQWLCLNGRWFGEFSWACGS